MMEETKLLIKSTIHHQKSTVR